VASQSLEGLHIFASDYKSEIQSLIQLVILITLERLTWI